MCQMTLADMAALAGAKAGAVFGAANAAVEMVLSKGDYTSGEVAKNVALGALQGAAWGAVFGYTAVINPTLASCLGATFVLQAGFGIWDAIEQGATSLAVWRGR